MVSQNLGKYSEKPQGGVGNHSLVHPRVNSVTTSNVMTCVYVAFFDQYCFFVCLSVCFSYLFQNLRRVMEFTFKNTLKAQQ